MLLSESGVLAGRAYLSRFEGHEVLGRPESPFRSFGDVFLTTSAKKRKHLHSGDRSALRRKHSRGVNPNHYPDHPMSEDEWTKESFLKRHSYTTLPRL